MPAERRDLLGVCNADRHPLDIFTQECCANCRNPECTRSLFGKLQFDQRAAEWFPRFFGDQDKMDHQDPRFAHIAGQNFIAINAGPIPEVGRAGGPSDWINPREKVQPPPQPQARPAPPAPAMKVEPPPPPVPPAPPVEPAPTPGLRRSVPRSLLLANTPAQSGMIPAPPSATPPPVPKDPWAGPVSVPKSEVPVVSPGARVKLGGSGV